MKTDRSDAAGLGAGGATAAHRPGGPAEGGRTGGPRSGTLPAIVALAASAGGVWLVSTGGRAGLSGGILLLVVALAAGAVALGGTAYGPAVEGRLDLSSRLAIGLLGGVLGGVVALAVQRLLGELGLHAALGVSFPVASAVPEIGLRLVRGGMWGLVFGVLLPFLPGGRLLMRGALFSLVPSLYVLLKVFPVDRDVGFLGHELGVFAFAFVILYNLVWALVTARTFRWAERTDEAPLSRLLGEG